MSFLGRHRRRFLNRLDREQIERAIGSAERETTGQIRVAILPRVRGDLVRAAELAAGRLGMAASPERNGVLIVVVPARHAFSIWGDLGVHQRVGDDFWRAVAHTIEERFARGEFTAGLIGAIEEIGRRLTAHFPRLPGREKSSLSDSVADLD